MLDPLSAASLAGTIVQFVDFSSKLLSHGRELYKSASGKLTMDEELELVIADLKALVDKVRRTVISSPSDAPGRLTEEGQNAQNMFEAICNDAVKIAGELLARLNKLKIEGTKNRAWKTLQHLVIRLWTKDEIDGLLNRLSTLKEALGTRVLFAILDKLDAHSVRVSNCFDEQTQRIVSALLGFNHTVNSDIRTTVTTTLTQLLSRLKSLNQDEHRRTRELIVQSREAGNEPEGLSEIIAGVEMLDVSQAQENKLRTLVQTEILKSLGYVGMTYRYEAVVDAHPNTFDWAFQDSTAEQLPWSNFATWLKSGKGVYWIHGKPGSGKSTLMKHIFDDHRTRRYLEEWALTFGSRNTPLCLATFFFWNSGTHEQKSLAGMLRALLLQVLEKYPQLIPIVLPITWAKQYSRLLEESPSAWSELWSLRELVAGFKSMLNQRELSTNLCLLIDGLDEFDGDHEVLAEMLSDITHNGPSNVKVCLSSRPLLVFKDTFCDCPKLQLQNLTFNDIKRYVHDAFNKNSAFTRLAARDAKPAAALIQEVVEKADGVFLWVWLVVKDVLRGIRNRDSIPDLWDRVRALPKDLEPLYLHLMGGIEPSYRRWASKVFQVERAVRELGRHPVPKCLRMPPSPKEELHQENYGTGVPLFTLSLAVNEGLTCEEVCSMSPETVIAQCQEIETHITARCGCFLEVLITKRESSIGPESSVKYLHRTARDFIEEPARWGDLVKYTRNTTFEPYLCLMRSHALVMQRISARITDKRTLQLHSRGGISWDDAIVETDRAQIKDLNESGLQLHARRVVEYASYADACTRSREAQTGILDEIDQIMTNNSREGCAWYNTIHNPASATGLISSFVDYALFLNLSGYVRIKTELCYPSTGERATFLLHRRLKEQCRDWFQVKSKLNTDMALTLLRLGADVNWKDAESVSIWEMALSIASKELSEKGQPETLSILSLLSAKADPRAFVTHKGRTMSSGDFINRYLSPVFPAGAARILSKLSRKGSITKQKRPYDFKAGRSNQPKRHRSNLGSTILIE